MSHLIFKPFLRHRIFCSFDKWSPIRQAPNQTLVLSSSRSMQSRSGRLQPLPVARSDSSTVTIHWPSGGRSKYDNVFLYDHCRCDHCFHVQTKQRLKTLSEVPADVHAESTRFDEAGLHVTWSTSGHKSLFPIAFLQRASYQPSLINHNRERVDGRVMWNSDIAKEHPNVCYQEIKGVSLDKSERGVLQLLNKVNDFGFCIIKNVPATAEDTKALIESIARIRETHYGGFWSFTADLSHGDLAYSAQALPAHTDTTYFTDPAGLQIFHCLSHPSPGKGGETLLVDGFYTASLLSARHPSMYSLLSRLSVPCHASGTAGTLLRPQIRAPIFTHDESGQLIQVRWNNEDRGVLGSGWTHDELRGWYDAAKKYEELVRSDDAECWIKLHPGTVLVIDNWRVMHGRSEFTGSRTMCGAYVGADDWRSRRSVLARKHSNEPGVVDDVWDVGW